NALVRGDPRGFHLTNVLLHVACVLLFWQLLSRLGAAAATAFGLALVFAAHPVGAEAITWINGCSEPLCLLFGLGVLLGCSRHGHLSTAGLLAIAACMCLSLLGKETGIVFFVLALGLLVREGDRRGLVRGASALTLGLCVYLVLRTNALAGFQHTRAFPVDALASLPALWFRSAQIAILPINLGLENLVAWHAGTSHLERGLFVGVTIGIVLVLFLLVWRRHPIAALGLSWWLAVLGPPSLTISTGGYWPGLARWVYVALPGLLLAIAPTLSQRLRAVTVLTFSAALSLALALETQRAIGVWENDETLLQHMITKYPNDWYAYHSLARHRLGKRDGIGALALLKQGRAACGPKTKLTCIEARTHARLGHCQESSLLFSAGPDCVMLANIDAWVEVGSCYAAMGDLVRARQVLSTCATTRPDCRALLAQLPVLRQDPALDQIPRPKEQLPAQQSPTTRQGPQIEGTP
ncbi:MAG: hypothetical protein V2A73_03370, partial [Pseudomonadota bacterium]